MKVNISIYTLNQLLIVTFFMCFINTISLAQEEKNRETLKINAGIFLINSNWAGQGYSRFVDLMGGLNISKPITNQLDVGITSLFLK